MLAVWMKGDCGNVMHGLVSLCHEAGNGGNNGRRCPKDARTVFLPDLDSICPVISVDTKLSFS